MRRLVTFLLVLMIAMVLGYATPAKAQIGKDVRISAGSPEDKALTEISSTADAAQKLDLIQKFQADYGQGDMAVVAYEQFVNYYLQQKDYDKVFEYGEKLFQVDPNNLANGVNLVRAAQERGDTAKLFDYGERVGAIVTRYKAQGPLEGVADAEWNATKAKALEQTADNRTYVEQTLFVTAYHAQDPAARAGLLARFASSFPDSSYANQAWEIAATSYQQAQNYPKMLEVANGVLAKDPNSLGVLILLADYYSGKGEELDKGEADANKALDVLATAKKPDGVTDEQWQQQTSLQKGLALSSLGQVDIWRKKNVEAIGQFKVAAPLLKPNALLYAKNQYLMGLALLNLKRVAEAETALTEAAAADTPYKALAQEKLNGLAAAPRRRP
ncbi:MAG: hypothetical protein ABSF92_07330 [Candidatus Acidiferrales bacterium]|jgi:tetratricopeptide (TPR) repeat protein